jgi:peroxiredoxin
MAINVGDRIPEATLMKMTDKGPQPVKTGELFKGRKVVVFALPGAFTPTCSNQHLPGFIKSSGDIKGKGVDEIVCLSVNDAFVMDAWGKQQGAGSDVTMLGDGNGDFTKALGLDFDGSGFGMGTRSLRYSMLVDDGVVKSLNKEPNPGEAKVSGAETMLQQLS